MKLGSKRIGTVIGIFLGVAVFGLCALFGTIALVVAGGFTWAEQMCVQWSSFVLIFSFVMMATATLVNELYREVRDQEMQTGTLAAGA